MSEEKFDFGQFDIDNILTGDEPASPIEALNKGLNPDPVDPPVDPVDPADPEPVDEPDPIDPEEPTDPNEPPVDEDEVMAFYKGFHEVAGIETPEDFKPEEGIAGIYNHLKDILVNSIEEETAEILSAGNGLVGDLYKYLADGGEPSKFVEVYLKPSEVSMLPIEGDDNEKNQDLVLTKMLELEGYEQDEIKAKIEKYTVAGIKEDEAKSAIRKLKKVEDSEKAKLLDEQSKASEAHQAKVQAQIEEVKTYIERSDEIGGLPISKDNKAKFFDYMFKVGKDGMTDMQRQTAQDKDRKLKMAYVSFLNFNLSDLKKDAKTAAVKDVKKALSRFTDTTSKAIQNGSAGDPEKEGKGYTAFKLPIH